MRCIWICWIAGLLLVGSCAKRSPVAADAPPMFPLAPKGPKRIPAGYEPDKAAAFYLERRVGAGALELPLERYREARDRASRMPILSIGQGRNTKFNGQRNVDLGGWESLGPENQGGRTKSLLIDPRDPNVMYAGAVTGGVWKTTDGGQNWLPLSDLFPTTGLGALAMDPSNPDVIYAGTGFWFNTQSITSLLGSAPRGVGIYRSRDAGKTWAPLVNPAGNHFRYINDIVVSRMDPNRIYAATWTGIFRTLDGGQSWVQVFARGGTQNGCQDLVSRSDQSTDYLFAACGTTSAGDAAIFRNTDAGADGLWTKVFQLRSMGNTTLAIAPSNPSIIYALMSNNGEEDSGWRSSLLGVYRSTQNGDPDSWEARVTFRDETQVNTGILSTNSSFYANQCSGATRTISGQGWIHNAIAVDPQDAERVYAGGIDIYRSDDGGRNWGIASFWQAADGRNGAHADLLGIYFPPDFDGTLKPHLYAVTDGGVYLTQNARAAVAQGVRAGCTPFQNEVAWTPLHGGYQTTQFYSGATLPGGVFFLGGKQDNGTLLGSLGNARNWRRLLGGDGAAVAVDPRDPNRMLASTPNFGLARTLNGGKNFLAARTGITEPSANFAFIAPLAMDLKNPDRLYAGATLFYRSDNQAASWVRISTALRGDQGYVSAVAVSPADPTKVVFGTSQGFVLRTANALEAGPQTIWESSQPRPGYLPSLTFDPEDPNVVYAVYSQFNTASDQSHIYRSQDGGATWEGIDGSGNTALPDIPVLTLSIDPRDRNVLYAGTDIGVFVSYDAGRSWARDSNPFAAVPTEALVLERGGGATWLYAFTFGRGVWRTKLPDSGSGCNYEVDRLDNISAYGGTSAIGIRTSDGCSWSALPAATALDVQSPATGVGAGSVNVTIPLNFSTAARQVAVNVQGTALTATQAGATQVPVAADLFASPAAISALPYVGIRDTRSTTRSTSDPKASCSTDDPQKTIWWRFVAPESGTLEVVTQGQRYDVAGNSGVVMSMWDANGPDLGPEVACVEIPRNQGAWVFRGFRVSVIAGSTYYFLASATGGAATDGGYTILGLRMVP